MRIRFLGYLGKPAWSFDLAGRAGWLGPIHSGEEREVSDELGRYIVDGNPLLFAIVEPMHAALEEPFSDKAIKSPIAKRKIPSK